MLRRPPNAPILIALFSLCTTLAAASLPADGGPAVAVDVLSDVVNATNEARGAAGVVALRTDPRLTRAAQIHAEQMARADRLAHVLLMAPYPRPEDRLAIANYRWRTFGENVAFGQSNAVEAVESWMHSRGHRANILNPHFTELGIGHATNQAGRAYYVQVFASRLRLR